MLRRTALVIHSTFSVSFCLLLTQPPYDVSATQPIRVHLSSLSSFLRDSFLQIVLRQLESVVLGHDLDLVAYCSDYYSSARLLYTTSTISIILPSVGRSARILGILYVRLRREVVHASSELRPRRLSGSCRRKGGKLKFRSVAWLRLASDGGPGNTASAAYRHSPL